MRRIALVWIAAAVSVCAAQSASAQDILRAMYSSRPVAMWNGVYVGGNVGYGWGKIDTTSSGTAALPIASYNMNGIVGGGQIGGNYQTGNLILGFELDFQGTAQKSNNLATIGGFAVTDDNKLPWFGTARLRAGYAMDALMVYGTGGLAMGVTKRTIQFVGASSAFLDHEPVKTGWAAGAGIEGILTKNWSWRVEYLHVQFPTLNEDFVVFNAGGVPIGTLTVNTKVTNDIVRFGVNYFLR